MSPISEKGTFKYVPPEDPVRYPMVQKRLESEVKSNFDSTLKVMLIEITKVLKNGK